MSGEYKGLAFNICTVKIVWYGPNTIPALFQVNCNQCHRIIGTFSKHESAMNWAQAHARSSKHIRG